MDPFVMMENGKMTIPFAMGNPNNRLVELGGD
jgi:hypothetical protein